VALEIVRGDPGNYRELVDAWLAEQGLRDPTLARPFLAPIEAAYRIGRRDVESALAEAWEHAMFAQLRGVAIDFPFDPRAREEVSASELEALFHPATGKFHALRRRFLDPVSEGDAGARVPRRAWLGELQVPSGMYAAVNRVDRLTQTLWDAEDRPRPLQLRVRTRAFAPDAGRRSAVTLVYLSAGEDSLFNFNQRPTVEVLQNDWTKERRARVGVELTEVATGEKTYPPPRVTLPSHWALLRLLSLAEAQGSVRGWTIALGKETDPSVRAEVELLDDPFEPFRIQGGPPSPGPSASKEGGR
jgi:type VI protein secretion system component VasK